MGQPEPRQTKLSMGQKLKANAHLLKEIYDLIRVNKKWWLLPIFFVFAIVSFLMVLVGGSSVLPAIYTLF